MKTPLIIRTDLTALADPAYCEFQAKLMPTVEKARVLGVRAPLLHKYEKSLTEAEEAAFLAALPHRYYDEDMLHVYILNRMHSLEGALQGLEAFLPYLDNWATCDCLRPRILAGHTDALLPYIEKWLASPHLYSCRLGIGLLLSFYLGDAFDPDQLARVAAIETEEYYLRMMQAWYFATALALQYDATLPYFTSHRLSPAVHSLAVRKACESYRIDSATKALLKTL